MVACVACIVSICSDSACSFSASSPPSRTLIILAESDTKATVTPKTARHSRYSAQQTGKSLHKVGDAAVDSCFHDNYSSCSQSNPLTGNKRTAVDGGVEDDKSNPLPLVEMLCVLNQPEDARSSRLVPARTICNFQTNSHLPIPSLEMLQKDARSFKLATPSNPPLGVSECNLFIVRKECGNETLTLSRFRRLESR